MVGPKARKHITEWSSHVTKQSAKLAKSSARTTVKAARVAHHHVAKVPHQKLMEKAAWYRRWHGWRWHPHVHYATLGLYLLIVGVIVFNSVPSAQALSTWSQTDWSGGVGTSTSNQYSAASSIDTTATANQATLSKGSNLFTNTTLDSNVTGWNGSVHAYDTTQSYSASGSSKITAGGSTASTFYAQTTASATNAASNYSASGDVTGDGIDDLVVANLSSAATLSIYAGTGLGTLGSPSSLSTLTAPNSVKIADFNNDGWRDIVVGYSGTTGKISVYLNNGSGSFTTSTDYSGMTTSNRSCWVETGLINNDAYADIAVQCSTTSSTYVFINNGSASFTMSTYASGYTNGSTTGQFTLADLNGDSRPEAVGSPGNSCLIYILPNNGGGFDAATSYTLTNCGGSSMAQYAIEGADVNNDGREDVLLGRRRGTTASGGDGYSMTVLLGSASNTVASQADYGAQSGVHGSTATIAAADFTGDGFKDVVATTSTSQSIVVYFANNGDGTFATKVDLSPGTTPTGVTAIDLNADNKPDMAVQSIGSSYISLFVNRTGGDAMTQVVNVGDTDTYQLEAYTYTTGAAVTSSDAVLYANGSNVSTTYTASAVSGWYKLTGTVTGANAKRGYGVLAKQGKTVYVDNLNLYKYASSGSLTSAILDPGYGGDWGTLTYSTTQSASVTVKVRTSNSSSMVGATAFGSCSAITSGSDISSNGCVTDGHRYIQYQVGLTRVSGDTPVFSGFSLSYGAYDVVAPDTNASSLAMKKVNGGATVASNGWTNGGSPYFTWTAGDDNSGGAGLKGYCAYLGTDDTADPVTTKGLLGTSPVTTAGECPFIVSGTSLDLGTSGLLGTALSTSNSAYYLSLKAVDIVGNIYAGSSAQFHFRFDNTNPTNPTYLSAPGQFVNTKEITVTWPSSGGGVAADSNSGVAGLQYKINDSSWYGDDHTGSGDITDLLANDGSYTTLDPPDFDDIEDGVNTVYLRTWDNAGNVTSTYTSAALKVNTNNAPSEPQSLVATPSTNTTNSFAFSWSAPATFVGNANTLTYCYTINTVPSSSNCTYTAAGVTSVDADAFATQPGANTFYVVARDESSNISYSSYASTTFTANTPAPGIPLNPDIADVSIKATSNWRLAVTWETPTFTGAGIANYKVYRSTDNNTFSQVGSSTSTSYVDSGLSQQTYYYYVKACDSANQCSAVSSTASDLPTGKFTSPATATSDPVVSDITTKRAKIAWSTDRNSDSKISIGTSSGEYSQSEIGNSSQVTAHNISLDNLAAGTTYYLKAKWTDEDGNTGTSQEFTFTTSPAPVLKEVQTTKVALTSATISYTVKDATRVNLLFGKSDAFGGIKSINTSASESTYSTELVGLDDGTKYYYKLVMIDSEGSEYQSSIFSLTTPPRPRITNLRFQPVEGEPTSTQKVSWETNVPTNSTVTYGKISTNGTDVQLPELKTNHEITIKDLEDSSEYFLLAQGRDADGNLAVSDRQTFKTALDTRPPKVSDITIEPTVRGSGLEARGQIVVSWRTDEPATSQVGYAEGSNATAFNNRTAEDAQLTTEHLVIVSDLPTSKVYSIQPISKDKASNSSTGDIQPAIIGRASDGVLNIVLNTLRKVFGF